MPWVSDPPAPLPQPRVWHRAAECDAPIGINSWIYVVGGIDAPLASTSLASVVGYDPSTGSWTAAPIIKELPTARSFAGVAAAPHRLHVVGGSNENGLLDIHEIYEPALNQWTTAKPLSIPRYDLIAVTGPAPERLIYAIGGWDQTHLTGTLEAYDINQDTWIQLPPMPTPRYGIAAVTGPDGLIYTLGGRDAQHTTVDVVEVYDPKAGIWNPPGTPSTKLPAARWALATAVAGDGRIWVYGGFDASGDQQNPGNALATVFSYDPHEPVAGWRQEDSLSAPRGYLAGSTGGRGWVYAIGGDSSGTLVDLVEVYSADPCVLLEREVASLEDEIDNDQTLVDAPDTLPAQRAQLENDIKVLKHRLKIALAKLQTCQESNPAPPGGWPPPGEWPPGG